MPLLFICRDYFVKCREHCGACCIAPSIHAPYFGMPHGKAAGQICIHLDVKQYHCKIWGSANYPETCRQFKAEPDFCGTHREEALILIEAVEIFTR